MKLVSGGVCAAKGFRANGIHCGIRRNQTKKDLALIVSDCKATAAGVYTTNLVKGAPLQLIRAHIADGYAQAVICNSGNANTCNWNGIEIAQAMCDMVSEKVGVAANDVIVASTGVIGQVLDLTPIKNGMDALCAGLSYDGSNNAADIRNKEERAARTENLCQFVEAVSNPPFPAGAWDAGIDPDSAIADDAPVSFAVDISDDRKMSAIAVCGQRPDGHWHVEVVAYKSGIAWLETWLRDVADPLDPVPVAIQGKGAPASSMVSVIGAIDGIQVFEVAGADIAGWTGRFYDAVAALDPDEEGRSDAVPVHHRPQAALDMAANVAKTRLMGDSAWAFDRHRSPVDVSVLVACAFAFGHATRVPDEEKPNAKYESVYTDSGVLTV